MKLINNLLKNFLILLIKFYKLVISPVLGNNCRFHPTCSSYSIEAIKIHGPVKGFLMSVRRVSKCHPFNPGGVDPVPLPKIKVIEIENKYLKNHG